MLPETLSDEELEEQEATDNPCVTCNLEVSLKLYFYFQSLLGEQSEPHNGLFNRDFA